MTSSETDEPLAFQEFLNKREETKGWRLDESAQILKKGYDEAIQAILPQLHPATLYQYLSSRDYFKGLPPAKLFAMCEDLFKWVNAPHSQPPSSERSFVGIDFEVATSTLTHTFDLIALQRRVNRVFSSYYSSVDDPSTDKRYHAPYFCFIQSSGMGKTKLLYEYAKTSANAGMDGTKPAASPETIVKLILCRPSKHADEEKVFHAFLDLPETQTQKKFQDYYNYVADFLSELIKAHSGEGKAQAGDQLQRIVLLFDEAHYLTDRARNMDAFWFRVIRLWLRCKHGNRRVVAVFSGTTSKLSNFQVDDDLSQEFKTDTREHTKLRPANFYPTGSQFFDPFYTTTTIGCLRNGMVHEKSYDSEYFQSVVYGRPLFAAMLSKDKLNDKMVENILKRMLLLDDRRDWTTNRSCCLNILATRIQMGQTTADIASDLVAHAYANLVGVDGTQMRICYPPDPVCARLAMCLMDEKYSCELDGKSIKGLSGKVWANKVGSLFSNRIFTVGKGDFGEVLVAFYFLLCADEIRFSFQDNYSTFSVPLDKWIGLLVKRKGTVDAMEYSDEEAADNESGSEENTTAEIGADVVMEDDDDSNSHEDPSAKRMRQEPGDRTDTVEAMSHASDDEHGSTLYFSAIQVCRNYFRDYANSWETFCDQSFLENMYRAAVGCYTFPGCEMVDCVFSLAMKKVGANSPHGFLPMFVSVKSRQDFTEAAAKSECEALRNRAKRGNPKHGAICVVVVFGAKRQTSKEKEPRLQDTEDYMNDLKRGNCVARVLRIPHDDLFGLSDVFCSMTSAREEMTEILTSHCFLSYNGQHLSKEQAENESKKYALQALRQSTCRKDAEERPMNMLSQLASQLKFGTKGQRDEGYPLDET